MKITKNYLRKIIKETLEEMQTDPELEKHISDATSLFMKKFPKTSVKFGEETIKEMVEYCIEPPYGDPEGLMYDFEGVSSSLVDKIWNVCKPFHMKYHGGTEEDYN